MSDTNINYDDLHEDMTCTRCNATVREGHIYCVDCSTEIARLTEALAVAEKRIAALEGALTAAAGTFRRYARLHMSKIAPPYFGSAEQKFEIKQKADANQRMAELCEAALRPAPTEPRRTCIVTDALCSQHCTDRCARVPNAKAGEWE